MKMIKSAVCVVFILLFVLSLTVFKPKISEKAQAKTVQPFKGVLSLWHIDSFEGGQGSRRQFLLDVAAAFEKKNDGVLIMASSHTVESAENNFKNGNFPDILSFSQGIDIKLAIKLDVKDAFIGGKIANDVYAAAWCRGGYVLIENPSYKSGKTQKPPLIVSSGDYNLPLIALIVEYGESREELLSFDVDKPLDAYVKFVGGEYKYLLGTQRDIIRLSNRGFNYTAQPLEIFNDLYQYAAVLSQDAEKESAAKEFINFLLSESVQKKLEKIKMFSPYFNVNFEEETLLKMQGISPKETLSVFSAPEKIGEIREFNAIEILNDLKKGDKIKNILLRP